MQKGIQLPKLQQKIKALREVGLRAEHVAFSFMKRRVLSGILPGYSCKEGRIVEDGLLVEFPCTPTRTRSVYSY
jgi:hypothetical protein